MEAWGCDVSACRNCANRVHSDYDAQIERCNQRVKDNIMPDHFKEKRKHFKKLMTEREYVSLPINMQQYSYVVLIFIVVRGWPGFQGCR